jgi:hypothetical protein
MSMPVPSVITDPAIRLYLGRELAAFYEAQTSPMPLPLIELMARFAVAEAMAEFDRTHPRRTS